MEFESAGKEPKRKAVQAYLQPCFTYHSRILNGTRGIQLYHSQRRSSEVFRWGILVKHKGFYRRTLKYSSF